MTVIKEPLAVAGKKRSKMIKTMPPTANRIKTNKRYLVNGTDILSNEAYAKMVIANVTTVWNCSSLMKSGTKTEMVKNIKVITAASKPPGHAISKIFLMKEPLSRSLDGSKANKTPPAPMTMISHKKR